MLLSKTRIRELILAPEHVYAHRLTCRHEDCRTVTAAPGSVLPFELQAFAAAHSHADLAVEVWEDETWDQPERGQHRRPLGYTLFRRVRVPV